MTAVGDARKRSQDAAESPSVIPQRPASPQVDPDATATPVGAQGGDLDVAGIRARLALRGQTHGYDGYEPGAMDELRSAHLAGHVSEAAYERFRALARAYDALIPLYEDARDDLRMTEAALSAAESARDAAEGALSDLVSRLGFGDNVTEPMADNDTVVRWVDEQVTEASEWRESQSWRNDCVLAGHPDNEDCYEHDPARRLEAAESALRDARAALSEHLEAVQTFATRPPVGDHGDTRWGEGYKRVSEHEVNALTPILTAIEAALDPAVPATEGGDQ